MEIRVSHCPEQEVGHRNMPWPGCHCGGENWGGGEGTEPVVQRLQPTFVLMAEVTMGKVRMKKSGTFFRYH